MRDDWRFEIDRAFEHAAGDILLAFRLQVRAGGKICRMVSHESSEKSPVVSDRFPAIFSAARLAKYVIIMSAPALFIEDKISWVIASSSTHPCMTAAFTSANSPETLMLQLER